MAHNIEIVNGKASFFTNRVPAWHNLGEVVDGAQTWEQAMKKAGLDFEVVKEQNVHPRTGELVNAYSIYRKDNDAFLGSVGERYTPIQNLFQFNTMDKIIGTDGGAHYETAGVLGKGERVFMLANLTDEYDIHGTGDKHKAYLAGVGSHDGSSSQRFFTTEVRIVCANTLQIALSKAGSAGLAVRHTVNAESRINAKLDLLKASRDAFKSTMEKLEWLAERKVNAEVVANTIAQIFGVTDLTKELPTKTVNSISQIRDLFESNDNDAFPEFRGTGYNLLNAVTEYTDHYKPVRMTGGREGLTIEQVRSDSAVFGLGADFKTKALDIILENTKTAPKRSLHKIHSAPAPKGGKVLDAVLSQYA